MNGEMKWNKGAASALLWVFLTAFLAAAGAAECAPAPIVNELTAAHQLVPGAGAYFAPAPGLAPSAQFDGFASAERRIEVIAAKIREPYAVILDSFTDETLKTRGVEAKSRGALSINGAEGVLIKALHADGENRWAKWILLLDGGTFTLVVNGVFVSGDDAAARDVEAMLKSAVLQSAAPASGDAETDAAP